MNRLSQAGLIGAALSISVTSSVIAKLHSDTSVIAGTWILNPARSKSAAPAMNSETRVYTVSGIKVSMHADGIDASGKHVSNSYDAANDGKFYPTVGNPVGDAIALRKVDSHTVTAILRKGAKVAATARAVVSHEVKQLTITRKIGTPPGKLVTTVVAYDRK
ncbi:MAG: hypothetical protein NVS3B5_11610 [Sphingomicrobium sp.]